MWFHARQDLLPSTILSAFAKNIKRYGRRLLHDTVSASYRNYSPSNSKTALLTVRTTTGVATAITTVRRTSRRGLLIVLTLPNRLRNRTALQTQTRVRNRTRRLSRLRLQTAKAVRKAKGTPHYRAVAIGAATTISPSGTAMIMPTPVIRSLYNSVRTPARL